MLDMATYGQAKRQKGRDVRDCDWFQGIEKCEYNSTAGPGEAGCYCYYNSSERLHSRTMEEWIKFSISLTHFRSHGTEYRHQRSWDDGTTSIDNFKRCIKALFELCFKLGVKYFTAFDSDFVWSDSLEESRTHWEDMTEYLQEMMQRYHVKLLWMAPDLHSHTRYIQGAFTSHDATTFSQAATQIKKCLEISQRLNAECFLIWPKLEGYDNIFQTDVNKEMKLFAKLLKLTGEYKERLNYRCQLLLMPYQSYHNGRFLDGHWQHCVWRENNLVNLYMWDVTSCCYFLKNYNLDKYYKVCTPPGHQMYMATAYSMLGGVTISNDIDHYDSKKFIMMMKCIVDQGSPPPAGTMLHLATRRHDARDVITTYIKYMDAAARGLRLATSITAEQMFTKHVQQRYISYNSGFGSRLLNSEVSMEECEEYYKKNCNPHGELPSSKSEQFDLTFQRYIESSDHV